MKNSTGGSGRLAWASGLDSRPLVGIHSAANQSSGMARSSSAQETGRVGASLGTKSGQQMTQLAPSTMRKGDQTVSVTSLAKNSVHEHVLLDEEGNEWSMHKGEMNLNNFFTGDICAPDEVVMLSQALTQEFEVTQK